MVIFYLLIFIFGLLVGSFLNCLIYRLEKSLPRPDTLERGSRFARSFLIGRSYCPHCKHILAWRDLIPIFSFLILKGRCRHCHQNISWQYPLVEIFTAFIFLLLFITNGTNYTMVYFLLISCFLIIIFVYDLKHYIIPDKVIYSAIVTALLYQFFRILNFEFVSNFEFRISDFKTLTNPLFSAIFVSTFFLTIVLFSRGKWMGTGDIKLAFFMGLFLGFPKILVALFLAFFLGAIIGIGLIISGKKTLKSEVPFGPFLVSGTFLALFWGQKIINWYLNFFL